MDEHAIKHAKALNRNHLNKIEFVHKNIFKHQEEAKFDLIWSAGLFDYFDDKAFVMILKKMKGWLNPTGEIIIGNFNESHNPSRNYMEILGDWHLHHRTTSQLTELAKEAGFTTNSLRIGEEKENVNLFLHAKNSK
jgi:cyclopropane fatty-acyl-phospholipid synthase-like methyltransferase